MRRKILHDGIIIIIFIAVIILFFYSNSRRTEKDLSLETTKEPPILVYFDLQSGGIKEEVNLLEEAPFLSPPEETTHALILGPSEKNKRCITFFYLDPRSKQFITDEGWVATDQEKLETFLIHQQGEILERAREYLNQPECLREGDDGCLKEAASE